MADNSMTSAEASNKLEAIKTLQYLDAQGLLSESEKAALDALTAERVPAEQALADTKARYSGALAGVLSNFDDEIRGAYNAANTALLERDIPAAKKAYAEYRDLQRQREDMLKLASPGSYEAGQMAGAFAQGGIAGGAGSKMLQGANWLTKILGGAGMGAAVASAPEVGQSRKEGISSLTDISPITAGTGAALGAASPIVGAVSGELTRGAQEMLRGGGQFGFKGSALRRVAPKLKSVEDIGLDVQQYLSDLTPEAMIADIPGDPQKLAQGLAAVGGPGASQVQRELTSRAGGAGKRIEADVSTNIDQPNAGYYARKQAEQTKYGTASPLYEAAKKSGVEFNVDDIRAEVAAAYPEMSTEVKARLDVLLDDLGEEGPVTAARLHNARTALNDVIFQGGGDVKSSLRPFLKAVDDKLDTLEGYATARATWADQSAIQRAEEFGREKALTGGKMSAISPVELEDMLNKMTDAEREAVKKGARDYIGALMGTSSSEASTAWRDFKKGWNAAKLRLLVGDEAAQAVTRRMLAEEQYALTNTAVQGGAQSAQRREAAATVGDLTAPDTGQQMTFGKRARSALIDVPLNRITNEILYGGRTEVNKQIGQILTLQGQERDQVVRFLLNEAARLENPTKTQQIVDAFTQAGLIGTAAAQGQ